MKKYLFYVLFFFCFSCLLAAPYINQPEAQVYYGGAEINFASYPVLMDGILYVPLRGIAHGLALEYKYNKRIDSYEIERQKDFKKVVFKLNSTGILVNNKPEELTYPVKLIKNSYYVPLNDFLWPLGYFVQATGHKYTVMSKIKNIEWRNKELKITAEAPITCEIDRLANTYRVRIHNVILGMHEKELVVEDGVVEKITLKQFSLNPPIAVAIIKTTTPKLLKYTGLQEDLENAFLVKFNYTETSFAKIPAGIIAPADLLNTVRQETSAVGTGWRVFSSNNALWLPEKYILENGINTFVIRGAEHRQLKVLPDQERLYVVFDEVFAPLGCRLVEAPLGALSLYDGQNKSYRIADGKITANDWQEAYVLKKMGPFYYVPLVQTLRLCGYAANYTDNKIVINSRIAEVKFMAVAGINKIVVKGSGEFKPEKPFYLEEPNRCVIDFYDTVFDSLITTFNVAAGLAVRCGQFDKNIARLVIELPAAENKVQIEASGPREALLALTGKLGQQCNLPTIIPVTIPPVAAVPALESTEEIQGSDFLIAPAKESTSISNISLPPKEQPLVEKNKKIKNVKVAIIVGHGGVDAGAISRSGYMEKTLTLEVSKKLAVELRARGAIPYLSREEDRYMSLEEQAEFAIKNKADLLISVHFNSFVNDTVSGAESYYYKPIDYELARAVHSEIIKNSGVKDKGVKKAQMHNLNHTPMPGVLIEPAFISNREEEKLIKTAAYQKKLAGAICDGIEKYLLTK